MSQYTTTFLPASKTIEKPLPHWPGNFPLAGAVYIEDLAKRGHFINEDDGLEALQSNNKIRVGNKACTHNARADSLDENYPRENISRYAMDTISMLGLQAIPSLNRHFSGSYSQDEISTEAAKGTSILLEIACNIWYPIFMETMNTYNTFWLSYQSPAITGSPSPPKHHERVAQHIERFRTQGHNTRSTGCSGGEAGFDGWKVVDEGGEGDGTDVAK